MTDQSHRGGSSGARASYRHLLATELFKAKALLRDGQSFSPEFDKRTSDVGGKSLTEKGGQTVLGCLVC